MRSFFFSIGASILLVMAAVSPLTGDYAVKPDNEILPIGPIHKTAASAYAWPRNINPLHALVVFTKFKGETPGDTLAPPWAKDLFNGQMGSVNDYFKQVSFGQYKVIGEYLPKMYEMPQDTTYYRTSDLYCLDIIRMLDNDPTVNLAKYDNDGMDGIPNSGDDDGFVDYIILVPRTRPYNFILKLATGVMNISLKDTYYTHNISANGYNIKVDSFSGCIATALNGHQALGTIVAEISHAYGADDLMDKVYDTPETDSAGVGYWCVLGHGALGWGGLGVPVGPCAYNRMLMNCIGIHNSNLVDLYGVIEGVKIKDVSDPGGQVFRMWINSDEYFLIEYRKNDGSLYYDNQLPKSGLLIWHIQERESNSTEEIKVCDLECADGLYADSGYPMGKLPDPIKGKDNLDYWAHDLQYSAYHGGNLGDSTDVFDGVKYTAFGLNTNPNSYTNRDKRKTGIEIFNIRKSGNEMMFDCFVSSIPGVLPPKAPLIGLGFQRSTGINANPYIRYEKTIYLMNFGLSYLPEVMVTITNDSLTVRDIQSLSKYETMKIIQDTMLPDEVNVRGTSITRENISFNEFENVSKAFGMSLKDIGRGNIPHWIQKVNMTVDGRVSPFIITLQQNFPNPFNSTTIIPFILSTGGRVTLEIFNILGQKIVEMDGGFQEAGSHTIQFKADKLPTGLYFYRLRGTALSLTKKFMIIR
ncbi:MAG: T9SS type A sorting domain-containing protein [Candidatus Latescibacter sp.]|nr:T9SS type A sorting domain-containing protein [Candidatus Latescibacter sp.]